MRSEDGEKDIKLEMSSLDNSEKEKLPLRKLLQGSVLILISNLIYISNNYAVAWTELNATEIALVRGTLQVIVFGVIVWRDRQGATKENKDQGPKCNSLSMYLLLGFYGFSVSTMSFACLAAIPLMPIGDLIVISFSSPVFSVFLDRIILKRMMTFLSIGLCFLIVLGDILVVQPPFMFKEEDSNNNSTDDLLETAEDGPSQEKHGQYYYVGVGLCFYIAVAGAASNVVGAQCNKMKISTSQLMLVSGFSSLLLSLISTIFLPNRLLTDPQSLSLKAAALLPVCGAITMVAYWTITLSISITKRPTLISMLRTTEILISLVTESLWWNQLPGLLTLFGSLLVAVCVLTMTAHDHIITAAKKGFGVKKEKVEIIDTTP